ncbi:MAG: hypothetical protein HKN43_10425, partial [Rhodothermales bacterium]|nr:hypothetical protein [Rhodothermales bacterium]
MPTVSGSHNEPLIELSRHARRIVGAFPAAPTSFVRYRLKTPLMKLIPIVQTGHLYISETIATLLLHRTVVDDTSIDTKVSDCGGASLYYPFRLFSLR